MRLKPLFGRVILKRDRMEKIGSIILPDIAKERHASLKCEIVAMGPSAFQWAPGSDDIQGVKVGDTVLIGKHAGAWLDKDGNPVPQEPEPGEIAYYIVQDEDILCIVEDEERMAA